MMFGIISRLLVITAGTGKLDIYTDRSNSKTNYFFDHNHTDNHLSFSPALDLVKSLKGISQIFDWISIIMIIIGLLIIGSSLIGNNGKWRKSGIGMIISSYIWLITYHSLAVIAPAFGNLSEKKLIIFIMMLLGQLLLYVTSSTLYGLGSFYIELYEMTGQPSLRSRYQQIYAFMIVSLIAGSVAYFIAYLF